MFTVNIVIQWPNGEFEGFNGFGFSKDSAHKMAIRKANEKAGYLPPVTPGKPYKELTEAEYKALPKETRAEILKDWEISARSLTT